jgi:hypothetical protein
MQLATRNQGEEGCLKFSMQVVESTVFPFLILDHSSSETSPELREKNHLEALVSQMPQ